MVEQVLLDLHALYQLNVSKEASATIPQWLWSRKTEDLIEQVAFDSKMVQHNYSFNTTKSLWEIGTGGTGHSTAEAGAEQGSLTSAPRAGARQHFMPWFPYCHL